MTSTQYEDLVQLCMDGAHLRSNAGDTEAYKAPGDLLRALGPSLRGDESIKLSAAMHTIAASGGIPA